jgi:serine/threonine protein kinase
VLDAVQYAHRNLVIHRDLKPGNILVSADRVVHLLDFGIAKLLSGEQEMTSVTESTEQGGRALTPDYASPEQIAGEPISTASDVYSLAVILYELVCGQPPYQFEARQPRGTRRGHPCGGPRASQPGPDWQGSKDRQGRSRYDRPESPPEGSCRPLSHGGRLLARPETLSEPGAGGGAALLPGCTGSRPSSTAIAWLSALRPS